MTLHNYHHSRQQNIAAVKTGKPWNLLGQRRKNDQMICFGVNNASLKTPLTPCSPSPSEWLCTSTSDDGIISFSPTGFQQVTDTQCLSLAVCASAWLCSRIDSFIGAICQQAFDDNRPWCGGADPSGSPLYRPRCHFDEAEVIMSLCACACEYAVAVCVSYSALSLHYRFNLLTIYTHTLALSTHTHDFILCLSMHFCERLQLQRSRAGSLSLSVRSPFTSAAIFNRCWWNWGFAFASVQTQSPAAVIFGSLVNFIRHFEFTTVVLKISGGKGFICTITINHCSKSLRMNWSGCFLKRSFLTICRRESDVLLSWATKWMNWIFQTRVATRESLFCACTPSTALTQTFFPPCSGISEAGLKRASCLILRPCHLLGKDERRIISLLGDLNQNQEARFSHLLHLEKPKFIDDEKSQLPLHLCFTLWTKCKDGSSPWWCNHWNTRLNSQRRKQTDL